MLKRTTDLRSRGVRNLFAPLCIAALGCEMLKIIVNEASASVDKTNALTITDPAGVPNQTWECKKAAGTKGSVVYMESIGIGNSVAVGASKNGTRNIIPITGGTTTGKVTGTALSGGAARATHCARTTWS